jgi:phosphatidylcholine synthase
VSAPGQCSKSANEDHTMTTDGHVAGISTPLGRLLSWGVHLFTALGAVFGGFALLELYRGRPDIAAVFVLVALSIDSMDGAFARLVGVTTHLPKMNGRRLDDMVDFLNFVIVGVVFMVTTERLLAPHWIALPILASAYGFSREDAKTDDDFFLGFPSYWNILAIYLWQLDISPLAGTCWVVGLALLVFVPLKYLYPSKLPNLYMRYGVSYGGMLWAIWLGYAILHPEWSARVHAMEWSLGYPALYMLLSVWLGQWWRRPADEHAAI